MKKMLSLMALSVALFANTQPYKKEIALESVTKPTLVRVALDNELYAHTTKSFGEIRLHNAQGEEEGYFIASLNATQAVNNFKRLRATSYNRQKGELVYRLQKPFEIETIRLNIEDRNFESMVDVYVDGKLIVKEVKIYDYSAETGMQKFSIEIPKTKGESLTIVYHLDKTTSFYKKYQHLRELSQYLTIKSIAISNRNQAEKMAMDRTEVKLDRSETKATKKESSYFFEMQNVPFSRLDVEVKEQNFQRSGVLYGSDDAKVWQRLSSVSLKSSTLNGERQLSIVSSARVNYLKLVLNNGDNRPLHLEKLTLLTKPKYLYFIANPKESYALYFGDKKLHKPSYELRSLVGKRDAYVEATLKTLEPLKVDEVKVVKNEISFFEKHKELLFMVVILLAVMVLAYVAFGLLKRSELSS